MVRLSPIDEGQLNSFYDYWGLWYILSHSELIFSGIILAPFIKLIQVKKRGHN